jgi:hypothetical protein
MATAYVKNEPVERLRGLAEPADPKRKNSAQDAEHPIVQRPTGYECGQP